MNLERLELANRHFGTLLAGVAPAQWDGPTPCTEWTVADLADHVTGGNRWAVLVLGGAGGRDALAEVRTTAYGTDRVAEHAASAAALQAAFGADGALDRSYDHLAGPLRGADFLAMRIADITVHAWDLARATGAEDRLPAELVEAGLDFLQTVDVAELPAGWFGPGAAGAGEAATAQDRMLRLSGRRP